MAQTSSKRKKAIASYNKFLYKKRVERRIEKLKRLHRKLKKENPELGDDEFERLFILEFKLQRVVAKKRHEEQAAVKRKKNRERVSKQGSRRSTGRSIWTVPGGRVSPR